MKVKNSLYFALAVVFAAGSFVPTLHADMFNVSSRGALMSSGTGVGVGPTATQNYISGGTPEFRNFFDFDLNTVVNQWVDSADVILENSTSATNADNSTLILHRVTEDTSAYSSALWSNIGAGASYGSMTVVDASVGNATVALNATGLMDLNEILGAGSTDFSVGGTSTGRLFAGSGDLSTMLDATLVDNTDPTAGSEDYLYSYINGGGLTLDAQFGVLTDDVDIIPYGDSIVSYNWTVNGNDAGTTASDTLMLTDGELAGFGITGEGTFDVVLTVTDEWGATGQTTVSLVSVPEPGTVSVLALGLLGLAMNRKRRR